MCTVFTTKYPTPKAIPEPSAASGTATARMKNPSMPISRAVRRAELLGATSLVSQT